MSESFEEENSNEEMNEEEMLKEELEEMEFGKLIQAKTKIEGEQYLNIRNKQNSNLKKGKVQVQEKFEKLNKEKEKGAPKEFSALIKPDRFKLQKEKSLNIKKKLRRDPRFDELSGALNKESFQKNYSFVKNLAEDYIGKVEKIKKEKRRNMIDESKYELIKNQINLVKGWVKNKKYEEKKDEISKELKEENRKRIGLGKKPIYFKEKMIKKLTSKEQVENKNKDEMKRYLKNKKHREMVKTKKDSKIGA
jgi:ribosomal RNA-processing protein 36